MKAFINFTILYQLTLQEHSKITCYMIKTHFEDS
jgi:hypothetical protein